MKNAVIRVDSSIQMGSGHVMRCLTLAEELRDNGYESTFVCREHEGHLMDYIKSKGFNVKELKKCAKQNVPLGDLIHANWLGVSQAADAEETKKALKELRTVDLLVIDHYGLDHRWETHFRSLSKKIFVIDDLADRKHDCDILLDQNYYLNKQQRYQELVNQECKLLLGPRYALLRTEFKEARKHLRERTGKIKRVLIFFGGSDLTNETEKALKAIQLLNRPNLIVDVVVGSSNPHKDEVRKRAVAMRNVNYRCQVSNMADLMVKADLAIGAGGSTTWERCYLGLPTLTIGIAENQSELLKATSMLGVTVNIGESNNVTIKHIFERLIYLMSDSEQLKEMSIKALDVIPEQSSLTKILVEDI